MKQSYVESAMRLVEAHPELWDRAVRAIGLLTEDKVLPVGTGFAVQSQSNGKAYTTILEQPPTCTCLDFQKRGGWCKHIIAAMLWQEKAPAGGEPAGDTPDTLAQEHKTQPDDTTPAQTSQVSIEVTEDGYQVWLPDGLPGGFATSRPAAEALVVEAEQRIAKHTAACPEDTSLAAEVIILKVGCPLNGFSGHNMRIVGEETLLEVKRNGDAWRTATGSLSTAIAWLIAQGYGKPVSKNVGRDDSVGMAIRTLTYQK
jgi:hypothetical protein